MNNNIIIIKGAGDIATAVAHKLFRSGFKVVMTEVEKPTCLRRYVSFANCIYEGEWQVEDVKGEKAESLIDIPLIWEKNKIPVLIDESCSIKNEINHSVLVDCILAKKNTGTQIDDAPLVIGLGPGFIAGKDLDIVIETNRGHDLGKIILKGSAERDTGIPGNIGGYSKERVLRSTNAGEIVLIKKIGDYVEIGDVVAKVGDTEVKTVIAGVIRGLIQDGLAVTKNFKIGDVDPRGNIDWVYTISDKGRCIAGGVLEAIMMWRNKNTE